MRASGTSSRSSCARCSILCTRLCTQNTWPSRNSSRRIASVETRSSSSPTNVRIGWRSAGGVCSNDMSRIPTRLISSVRGIGVAVNVSTSTLVFNFFIISLCVTPNRCSSSTTSSPRSLNFTPSCNKRCVPITQSTSPLATPARTFFACELVRKRDRDSTRIGYPRKRSANVFACCDASNVVGTSTATCLPS